ncbi:hypothetical protein WJX74_005750 [Apatococcus lobatus]|uniref:RNA helicase n=1 Tax=Apatococcus lobatus TaxID=904363 RepID=A0AAW1RLU3_9CHLO
MAPIKSNTNPAAPQRSQKETVIKGPGPTPATQGSAKRGTGYQRPASSSNSASAPPTLAQASHAASGASLSSSQPMQAQGGMRNPTAPPQGAPDYSKLFPVGRGTASTPIPPGWPTHPPQGFSQFQTSRPPSPASISPGWPSNINPAQAMQWAQHIQAQYAQWAHAQSVQPGLHSGGGPSAFFNFVPHQSGNWGPAWPPGSWGPQQWSPQTQPYKQESAGSQSGYPSSSGQHTREGSISSAPSSRPTSRPGSASGTLLQPWEALLTRLRDLYAQLPSGLLVAVAEVAARQMTNMPGPTSMNHVLSWRRTSHMVSQAWMRPRLAENARRHIQGLDINNTRAVILYALDVAAIDRKLPVLLDADLMKQVDQDLRALVQAYVGGERIPSFGGNSIVRSRDGATPGVTSTASRLPIVAAEDLEQELQQCLLDPSICKPLTARAKPPPKAHPPIPMGTTVKLPQEVAEWKHSGGLLELHTRALKDPHSLLGNNRLGLYLGPDIDFGIKRIKPASSQLSAKHVAHLYAELAGHQLHDSSAPEASLLLNLLCNANPDGDSEDPGQVLFLRQLQASYQGPLHALLLDISCAPARPHTFAVMDDFGLASNSWSPSTVERVAAKKSINSSPHPSKGTVEALSLSDRRTTAATGDPKLAESEACQLQPGQQFPLSICLDSSDGPYRRGETGIISQFVLFTFAVPAAAVAAAGAQQGSCFEVLPGGQYAVAVLGRCISAALSRKPGDVQECLLNVEAKPYISESLRQLFDTEPDSFHASIPSFEMSTKTLARELPTAQQWWTLSTSPAQRPRSRPASAAGVTSQGIPTAARQNGAAMALWRAGHITKGLTDIGGPAAATPGKPVSEPRRKELLGLSRLLLLEHTSMEHDIKRFDMFHVPAKYAVFQDMVRGRQRYLLAAGAASLASIRQTDDAESATYTGPNLDIVLGTEAFPGHKDIPHVLLALDVPGLPEKRPGVTVGDIIYLRPAEAVSTEFATHVISAAGTTCLLCVPPAFWQDALEGGMPKPVHTGHFHVRFSFDRAPLLRMHTALCAAATSAQTLLPSFNLDLDLPSDSELQDALKLSNQDSKDVLDHRPPSKADVQAVANGFQEVGQCRLNAEQRLAVASVMSRAGGDMPFALFGPPGTGKTVTLVECALQLLKTEHHARLLLCAPQNYSADLLCSALAAARQGLGPNKEPRMLRLNDPRLPPNQTKDDVIKWSLLDESTRAYRLPTPEELVNCNVVVATCSAAALLGEGTFQKHLHHKPVATSSGINWEMSSGIIFTHVLIDEAGQALLPEALIPLTFLQPSGQALLCGDPRQLGPVVHCEVAAEQLANSLLERFIVHHSIGAPRKEALGLASGTGMLLRNYRSHSRLLELPSRLFYSHSLVASAAPSAVQAPAWSELTAPDPQDDPAAAPLDLASAPAKGYLESLLEQLNKAHQSSRSSKQDANTHDENLDAESSLSKQGRNGKQDGAAGFPGSTGQLHSALDDLAKSNTEISGSTGTGHAAASHAPAQSRMNGHLEGQEVSRGAPAQLAQDYTDADDRDGNGEDGEAETDEFEEQLPTNTLFYGVAGKQMREGEAPSYYNPFEAEQLVTLVTGLLSQHERTGAVTAADIGVICTYRKQVQKIRGLLRAQRLSSVRVGTVDDFQGQEARIIFISTVLTRPASLPPALPSHTDGGGSDGVGMGSLTSRIQPDGALVGFWRNPKRFNVAITRAKALLVVVGHPLVLMEDKNWRELLKYCAAREAYRGFGAAEMEHWKRSEGSADDLWGSLAIDSSLEHTDGEMEREMHKTMKQLSEYALLGVGAADSLFPSSLDEMYAFNGTDEQEWRVVL